MHRAKLGDRVRIQYSRLRHHAAATDKLSGPRMLEFTVGSSELIPAVSLGVVGMAQGDKKHLILQPKEAYGARQASLIKEVPLRRFPRHVVLRKGKRLTAVNASTGHRRRVRVLEVKRDSVIVDGNHPLAGKVVELEVRLISLDSSSNANKNQAQFDDGGES